MAVTLQASIMFAAYVFKLMLSSYLHMKQCTPLSSCATPRACVPWLLASVPPLSAVCSVARGGVAPRSLDPWPPPWPSQVLLCLLRPSQRRLDSSRKQVRTNLGNALKACVVIKSIHEGSLKCAKRFHSRTVVRWDFHKLWAKKKSGQKIRWNKTFVL